MRTRTVVALVAMLVTTGAVAAACSSPEEAPQAGCDPATQACDDGGSESSGEESGGDGTVPPDTEPAVDTSFGDGPPGDGVFVPPDGYVPCRDGGYVCGPDGDVIPVPDGGKTVCYPGTTQCTDCVDNDMDGLTDWMDPECTGPLDRDESSFATGIPGDNIDPCKQDCWFDGNSGSGNDGCTWDGKCLEGSKEPKCPYNPVAAKDPRQCPPPSEKCIKYCKPLTPKGCDCAGCCDVYDSTGKVYTVKLVAGCSTETLGDATKCPPCGKIPECTNPCGKCEWCLGKTSLPAECYPPPPPDAGPDAPDSPPADSPPADSPPPDAGSSCPAGYEVCSPTTPCPAGKYCLTGCCITPPS